MTVPRAVSNTSHTDPYELDRLAEELATRESKMPAAAPLLNECGTRDLPVYLPLTHDDVHLTADVFNVEEFLLSRSHTSLPDLRSELRDYLVVLKEELVRLINDDYEAFISLSTDLKDEGVRLNKLKHPLYDIKRHVLESKIELQAVQQTIQEKLEKRAVLREEQSLLHLLLKISESLTRIESLLSIVPPENASDSQTPKKLNLSSHLKGAEEASDEKIRTNQAKHLGRVAAEFTHLLYHVAKAKAEKCLFVNEVQWRIDRVQSTISSDLDHLFSTTLSNLTDSKGGSRRTEIEKTKWITDLTECLRTYDLLGLWRDAEDVLRKEVVRDFMKKTIHQTALTAPYSPIVPQTPFPTSEPAGGSVTHTSVYPQTPYTPFTAFMPKGNHSNQHNAHSSVGRLHIPMLDEDNDSLARLYNQILRFVEKDICRLMDVAEKVSVRSTVKIAESNEDDREKLVTDTKGFQIMANVIWNEIARAIIDEVGSIVFAAGRPNDFRRSYETTRSFIRSLELLAPSLHAIEAMRTHPLYSEFERHWQLPVYFQLRWKEIVGKLEDSLSVTQIDSSGLKEKGAFATQQAAAVWVAVTACWSAEIYIPDICHRFWKLTLQILSRYNSWLDNCISTMDTTLKYSANSTNEKQSQASPGMSRLESFTPSTDVPSPESQAADDTALRQYATITIDLKAIHAHVLSIWEQEIRELIVNDFGSAEDSLAKAQDALDRVLANMSSFIPLVSSQIISILVRRCCDALLPVRSIPSQFRAMSNKRNPTEPSYFVPTILRPVKQFFAIGTSDGPGYLLKDALMATYATETFNGVAQRYIYYLTAMRKTEESLRRLKKGKKSTFSLFGNTNTGKDEGHDEERIRTQMILDVEAFGRDAQSLGIVIDNNDVYKNLKEMVYSIDESI